MELRREPGRRPGIDPHFDGRHYFNPEAQQARGFLDVMRWQRQRRPEPSPDWADDVAPTVPPARAEAGRLHVTFIHHATVLLQGPGWNLLTDPIWSERASPVSWLGPRRHRRPGVRQKDLPHIDAVLISPNHYDHLDWPPVRCLAGRDRPHCVVPAGGGRWMQQRNIGPVWELDWGESLTGADLRLFSAPAAHFSARGLHDRNCTLWCGYVIETTVGMIYFAGDTGFGRHFAWIREQFGPPTLALLPIGAYAPRWFMGPVHMAPEDALQAHEILGAGTSIAIHHGTFRLTDEALDTPRQRLEELAQGQTFYALRPGESWVF